MDSIVTFFIPDNPDITKLNQIVNAKTFEFYKANPNLATPEFTAVRNDKRVVYKNRFTLMPKIVVLVTVSTLTYLVAIGQGTSVLLSIVFSFFYYDIFSGALHIVLDNPNFIRMPVLGDSCLEFQWHHHIPIDITMKSIWEVCGDLNATIIYTLIVLLSPWFFNLRNTTAFALMACKVLMAYFGQYCHRMSHTPSTQRPFLVQKLQDWGIMISAAEHGVHHKTYDGNFCIGSGIFNPLLTWVIDLNFINQWGYILIFLSMLVFDVPLANFLLTQYAGFP
jgi:palmitoyl-[glycerolipid] 3-(E)-desaturase